MKEKTILSIYFVVWLLLVIFFGKIVISIIALGIFAGIIYSGGSDYSSELKEKIGWTCFSAVFIGNIAYVLIAGLFPESSWWYIDFTFWEGASYIAGLTILNAPFNFWIFSGD